jgi:hypothetical protein
MKPQAGVVYGHGETGLYTNGVRTLGSVREGRRALVTVGSGKMCVGIKIPFEVHRKCGNRDMRKFELVRNRLSRQISAGKPVSVGSVGRCPEVKPQRLGVKVLDLDPDRPKDGGHVSRGHPRSGMWSSEFR